MGLLESWSVSASNETNFDVTESDDFGGVVASLDGVLASPKWVAQLMRVDAELLQLSGGLYVASSPNGAGKTRHQ